MESELIHKVFCVTPGTFDSVCLEVFRFQYEQNPLYRQFADALGRTPGSVTHPAQIPFLPIDFFKTHEIKTTRFEAEKIFESSGTTGMASSRHHVKSASVYETSFLRTFRRFYGDPEHWCIIGLLPSYLERGNSSLVYMVEHLIKRSGHARSGFYLYDFPGLRDMLLLLQGQHQQVLLIGVTFALVDFANAYPGEFPFVTILETGGMKGRKEEITRDALHQLLQEQLGVKAVHSEYGMTELLSQAYAGGDGIFDSPPWMKVLLREEDDPLALSVLPADGPCSGAINVIDLANIYSSAFLATGDLGRLHPGGGFEVIGRLDISDIRGCSLLTA